jgi:hypothetical protein
MLQTWSGAGGPGYIGGLVETDPWQDVSTMCYKELEKGESS